MIHTQYNLSGDPVVLFTFIAYIVAVMFVGVFAFFVTRNLSDYVLGGRRLGGAVAALSAGASDMSSWLLMGLPGAVYFLGLSQIWVSLGLVIGAYTCWVLLAKRLRIYSEVAQDSVTIPAYLDNRFRDKSKLIRMIAALTIMIFFIFYIAAGLYAGGLLLSSTFGLEYSTALWLGTAIIILYTCVGGFLAVSWTDFFQGNLMLICLLIVPFYVIGQVGGWTIGMSKVRVLHPEYFQWTAGLSPREILNLVSWGLGYFGMPHILVRFMSVKSTKEIPLARRVCISWMSLSLVGAVLVGIVGAIYFCECPLGNRETVFMELSKQMFPSWMMGIVLAAVLSSSMCAIDSQMLAASSALTEDFYHVWFRRNASQRELMLIGRITVLFIAAIALYLARKPEQSIMSLVSFAWAGLGATFGPSMVLSLYWRRTTRIGVVLGMLSGASVAILWRFSGLGSVLYEIIPATLCSTVGVVMGSWFSKPGKTVVEEFDRVIALTRE